ncbi:unnamed protein product [Auanema sp. JU1783]|nr:unnamed protein product [Auanema sp. JU1783]
MEAKKDQVFGAYYDEENKLRFYNCVPVKTKESKKKIFQSGSPLKKNIFGRIFRSTDSGSELSIDSSTTNSSK